MVNITNLLIKAHIKVNSLKEMETTILGILKF